MNKSKKHGKPRSIEDLLQEQCPFHLNHKHSAAECQKLKSDCFTSMLNKAKNKDKADDDKD